MKDKISSLCGVLILLGIFFGLGPACTIFGLHHLVAGPGEVTCGSQVMHEGDTCDATKRGNTVDTTSYKQARDQHNGVFNRYVWPSLSTLLGGTITLVGLWFAWRFVKNRRKPTQPAGP